MTPEEFDRRVEEARSSDGPGTATDRAFAAAMSMAYEEDPAAAQAMAWNHPPRRLGAAAAMGRWRAIATGENRAASGVYAAVLCGECPHAVPAVFCPLTHRAMLADAHGDPGDCRCAASIEYERRLNNGSR